MSLPQYQRRVAAPAPFTMLAPQSERASDPSRGESGNPVFTRLGVTAQSISLQNGKGLLGSVGANTPLIAIKMNSLGFANVEEGSPASYPLDEISVSSAETHRLEGRAGLQAGVDFGFGMGNVVSGDLEDMAVELAAAINALRVGVYAEVDVADAERVLLSPLNADGSIAVSVSCYSYRLLASAPPFILEDIAGGTLFSSATDDRSVGTVVVSSKNIGSVTLV